MKKWIISLLCIAVLSLSGCAGKQVGSKKEVSDYQAYTQAVKEEPKTFDRFSIDGAKMIKIKAGFGKELTIKVTDELKQSHSSVAPPKPWYSRALDTVDNIVNVGVPATLKGWGGWLVHDAFKYNQGKVAKNPVVVEQRLDTVSSHESTIETVEVVNQQELVVVQEPLIIETTTNNDNSVNDNSQNTTNNYDAPEVP
jgi:hypothetical protein